MTLKHKKALPKKTLWQTLNDKYQKKVKRAPQSIWTNPVHFVACGFGVGTIPLMPGTFGTLLAVPLAIIMSTHLSLLFYALSCLVLCILGVIVSDITNRDFGTQDHPAAVIDELATFPIALFALPISWPYLLCAFFLFRFFDIVKPGPIRWVDKNIHGGIGVMLDDILAAIATLAVLHFITWVLGIHA